MAARGILAVVLASLSVALALPATGVAAAARPGSTHVALSSLESGVVQQLNAIRVQHHLTPLKLNTELTSSSSQHSHEMAADGYFEHESFDGTLFWKRIAHWYGDTGYGYWSVGENLLWSSPDVDPSHAMQMWMHSPEHRANILDPKWREIGVSAVHAASAPGTYQNLPVTIITTDFGVRH